VPEIVEMDETGIAMESRRNMRRARYRCLEGVQHYLLELETERMMEKTGIYL
jgi:hypothetical protein